MLLKLGGVSTVVVSSRETAKQVLREHDLHCCSRPRVKGARKLSYNYRDIAFSRYDDYWKELRKLCIRELFSPKRVQSIQPIKEMEMKKLIASITESAFEKTPVNLSDTFLSLNANVICKASFGVSFQGTVLNNEKFQDLVHQTLELLGRFSASEFFPYIGWIFDWFKGLHARRDKCARDLDAFYEQMIDLHLQKNREARSEDDFVDLLLRLEKEEAVLGYGKLTRDHIKGILMGGINTSAITMAWAMAELARNPRVMKKVQSEIRNLIGKNNKARTISLDETDQLNYLKMVIKETWRLHPVSPLLVPREVISEFKINGYTIQPKTRLHVNVWAIGRDPEEFIPERFMDCDTDVKGQHFELLPFGSGRRICPAVYMGTASVQFVLANLLYQFDWKLPEGVEVEDIDMDETAGLTTHKKHDLILVPVKSLDL
ncbi:unnamed protein product [Thlaspi arvense]|uniref:Cytochrome P450 n=1 Tax=Thlaspi arvense TaxID=13288 RepID=A0AAU9SSN0_THLAR|nr:unnamed protein product [Thlaspi arvense]